MTKEAKRRDAYYRTKYGITLKTYNIMLRHQKSCCALCNKHVSNFSKRLAVEHNHKTGHVRALVCFRCNKFQIGRHTLESAKAVYEYFLKFDGVMNEPSTL